MPSSERATVVGVVAAGLIVVLQDRHSGLPRNSSAYFVAPLAGAADAGGRDQPFVVEPSASFSPSVIHTVASPEARRPGSR